MKSFCEEDYAITRYLAEFVSTLTNLAYGMSVSSVISELSKHVWIKEHPEI